MYGCYQLYLEYALVYFGQEVLLDQELLYIYEFDLPHSLYDYHREYLQQDLQRDVVQNPCDLNHK